MSLLSTARALDDAELRWRVMAAQMEYAQGFGTMTGLAKNYAISVMLNPQHVDPSMFALVAIDDAISNAILVSEDNTVDTTAVKDTDITRVVASRWNLVANKYTTDPLAPPAAG